MYPYSPSTGLRSYQLFIGAETRITPFTAISPISIRALRLTGECHISKSTLVVEFPALKALTMVAIIGNSFDRADLSYYFPKASLNTFIYKHGHKLGFEIRTHHLMSLAHSFGARLRKLVLLGVSRPKSAAIAHCLRDLNCLEYLALSLITVAEIEENFVLAIPATKLVVLKLAVRNAWYALPLYREESLLCDCLEERFLLRNPPLQEVCVDFRDKILEQGGRLQRWNTIAAEKKIQFDSRLWEMREEV
jgi:hypothetical protein